MEEKNTVEDYYDMFSNLPDEILCHIVSFLPNESSLETSLISTRWRNLWNEALIRYGTKDDVTDIISRFLKSFEDLDPLKHPRKLKYHFAEDSEEVLVATIASNSNKLLIDFSPWINKKEPQIPQVQYELNLKLKMQHCINCKHFPSNFIVKALYLKSVSYLTSDVASSIVSSLDHIENLVIIDCNELKFLSIDSNSSRLHKLTILDCLQLKSLHLRTSKLRSFRYRGPLPWIWPEYHFNLSDARFDFRQGPCCSNFNAKDFDATLLTIKNSEVLTLCKWTFEELIWPSISDLSGSFKFYKLRELCWIESYEGEYNNSMDALFSFLKLCPELEQLLVTIDPQSYSATSSNSCLMQATESTKLEHLKLIKFMGFTSCWNEISVAKKLVQLVDGKPPKILASDGSCLDAEPFEPIIEGTRG